MVVKEKWRRAMIQHSDWLDEIQAMDLLKKLFEE